MEGAGKARLALRRSPGSVVELTATLVGRDGSAIRLFEVGTESTVPVREYRLGTVTLALDVPDGGPRWSFVFSDNGRRGDPVWYKVAKGSEVVIDPIGPLELTTGLEGTGPRKPGDTLELRPGLFTADGLLIVTSYRGRKRGRS